MHKDSKIYIAGHRGLVGSAILQELQRQGYTNLVYKTHEDLDLIDQKAVQFFFQRETRICDIVSSKSRWSCC